jgi:hypothetical protein
VWELETPKQAKSIETVSSRHPHPVDVERLLLCCQDVPVDPRILGSDRRPLPATTTPRQDEAKHNHVLVSKMHITSTRFCWIVCDMVVITNDTGQEIATSFMCAAPTRHPHQTAAEPVSIYLRPEGPSMPLHQHRLCCDFHDSELRMNCAALCKAC